MTDPTSSSSATVGEQPPMGCLLRLVWMAFGNAALIFAGLRISRTHGWSRMDAVYGLVLVAMFAARYFDVTRFRGMTTKNTPATVADLRRYGVALLVVGSTGWAIAKWVSGSFS